MDDKKKRRLVEKGKWFRGNFFLFSSSEMKRKTLKYERGVKKPTAVETKTVRGRTYSRFYYKPIQPGEFWD